MHDNKFRNYRHGLCLPTASTIREAARLTQTDLIGEFSRDLWYVLDLSTSQRFLHTHLLRRLESASWDFVIVNSHLQLTNDAMRRAARAHVVNALWQLSLGGNLTSLTVLTALYRRCCSLPGAYRELGVDIAEAIFRCLLSLGSELALRNIVAEVYSFYLDRIFKLGNHRPVAETVGTMGKAAFYALHLAFIDRDENEVFSPGQRAAVLAEVLDYRPGAPGGSAGIAFRPYLSAQSTRASAEEDAGELRRRREECAAAREQIYLSLQRASEKHGNPRPKGMRAPCPIFGHDEPETNWPSWLGWR